jgi:hypothetical protein
MSKKIIESNVPLPPQMMENICDSDNDNDNDNEGDDIDYEDNKKMELLTNNYHRSRRLTLSLSIILVTYISSLVVKYIFSY